MRFLCALLIQVFYIYKKARSKTGLFYKEGRQAAPTPGGKLRRQSEAPYPSPSFLGGRIFGNKWEGTIHSHSRLYFHHTVPNPDVRLNILGRIGLFFQLFSQSCHEDTQRGHIIFPAASPYLLGNIRMSEDFPYIFTQ